MVKELAKELVVSSLNGVSHPLVDLKVRRRRRAGGNCNAGDTGSDVAASHGQSAWVAE